MAKKALGEHAARDIVLSALKGIASTKINELHLTLEALLPKKSDQGVFTVKVIDLVKARNYSLPKEVGPFAASMRIKDIIRTLTAALPGYPTTPEPDKPVPTIPSRKSPGQAPRKEKKKTRTTGS